MKPRSFEKRSERGGRSERYSDKGGYGSGERRSHRPMRLKPGIPKGTEVDFKNITFLQKFVTERGKISSRRYSSITAKEMRELSSAIKHARFLALLPVGSSKRK